MELIVESDIYLPSIDENDNYVDKVPSFNIIKRGLLCPCGSRRDKKYDTSCIFSAHITTKTHQKWLNDLNLNKLNQMETKLKIPSNIILNGGGKILNHNDFKNYKGNIMEIVWNNVVMKVNVMSITKIE